MKFNSQLLAVCLIQANVSAFVLNHRATSPVALRSSPNPWTTDSAARSAEIKESPPPMNVQGQQASPTRPQAPAMPQYDPYGKSLVSDLDMFPIFPTLETIQGGGTVSTYQMPLWAERCQMRFETNGRPLKGEVNLWTGPIRTVHTLKMDVEDGAETPYQATIKFKKLGQVLRVSTSESLDLPIMCGVYVPSPERSDELAFNTEKVWENCGQDQKQKIQGGSTLGGGGAVRYWTIPPYVESVQMLNWSKDTSKKSFKVEIEVLQGPNNIKQKYTLQCGGGSQPYHAVMQTPGDGCVIRIINKKFLEDGLTQVAIIPYEVSADAPDDFNQMGHIQPKTSLNRHWWQKK